MAVVLFGGKSPPGRLAKRLTGDEAFWILETIVVDGDRLEIETRKNFVGVLMNEFYVEGFWTSVETIVFKP